MNTPGIATHDAEHLRRLAIFHWLLAALTALFSLLPVINLVIGIIAVNGTVDASNPTPAAMGGFFVESALLFVVFGLGFSVPLAYAGRCLQRRERYTFCLVMAALACMQVPFGTVLGVFTLVTLVKPSVKAMFAAPAAPAADA
jgi:hypothetical protein